MPTSDTTDGTPLAGSPKEIYLTKSDIEARNKALDQLNLAINKLLVKPSEQSKENQADGSAQETEAMQLKQMKSDSQVLKEILDAYKAQNSSKALQVNLATSEISKNFSESKELQKKHLLNAEEIESRLRTSAILDWVQLGAGVVGAVSLIASIALAVPTGGASLTWSAFASAMMTNLSAASVPSLLGAGASVTQGVALGTNTYQKGQINDKRAENEGYKNQREESSRYVESRTKETTTNLNSGTRLDKTLDAFVQKRRNTIKSIASQIGRD